MEEPLDDELVIIFRTHSDVEASVVRGLLETHGIRSLGSSDVPHSVFPLTINGLGEVRISVRAADADEAQRIIESHRGSFGAAEVVPLSTEFEALERRLQYRFRDPGLLEHGLTHRSRAHEDITGGVFDNESMEFLGDAVLGFVIADLLFREFPEQDEGQKSKLKASLVSAVSLARLAEQLGLGEFLLLGRGEEKTGGRRKQALLADAYEALIAAIYLDGGVDAVERFIRREFAELVDHARGATATTSVTGDYKSALQEYLQSHELPLPEYRVAAEMGPDHHKIFEVEVVVAGDTVAQAQGRTKKSGEQEAARLALERYEGAEGR